MNLAKKSGNIADLRPAVYLPESAFAGVTLSQQHWAVPLSISKGGTAVKFQSNRIPWPKAPSSFILAKGDVWSKDGQIDVPYP